MDRRAYLAQVGLAATAGIAGCVDGDGGTSPTDGGTSPTDGGTSPTDDGTTSTDDGTTSTDDGTTSTDDGPTPTDSDADGTATATPSLGCDDTEKLVNGSFECGDRGWSVGRDLPTDPNTGEPVATNVAVTGFGREEPTDAPQGTEAATDGSHALELSIDGRQDDGTLWVQQPADLAGCSTLSVDVYSRQESFNTITKVATYAGPEKGLAEADFDTSETPEDHAGWKTYEYPVDHDAQGIVAVGISVVWETEVVRYLDDVRLV